jgi:molybdenum cofactor cytidylyltransferase
MICSPRLEIILLAAGHSRRMGSIDKRLIAVGGEPLVRRSARLYCDIGLSVLVVARADDEAIAGALAGLDVRVIANPDSQAEQGASALLGLAACGDLISDGIIIALADQPLLTGPDIAWLIAEFASTGGTRICIPRHGGARGNPVILPAALARALRDARPPITPRAFVDAHAAAIHWCEADHPRFTEDIDTPDDALRLLPQVASQAAGTGLD